MRRRSFRRPKKRFSSRGRQSRGRRSSVRAPKIGFRMN